LQMWREEEAKRRTIRKN